MKHFLTVLLVFAAIISSAQKVPFKKIVKVAEQQYQGFLSKYPDSTKFARSSNADGSYRATNASDWTSGFFPGNMWYMYRLTNNKQWENVAKKWTAGIESQKNNTATHDLGFMMYDSFGNGFEITGSPVYKDVLIQSAKSLATRFHPEVGMIKSWDGTDFQYPVIIDNLMNLQLLFWATRVTGDSSYRRIAITHANMDLKNRFRADNSSYHVLEFDPQSGVLLKKMTHQGYADESCWARGQAWGIYGYTVLYRETKNEKYLDQAVKAAEYFLSQTDKISDHIPYWDFQAPDIPNAPRDASAAAITASAFFELSKYAPKGNHYKKKAEEFLNSLGSDKYLSDPGTNNFFLLKHSTGHKPAGTEIDVPIIYADYYLLEALWRYKNYSTLLSVLK